MGKGGAVNQSPPGHELATMVEKGSWSDMADPNVLLGSAGNGSAGNVRRSLLSRGVSIPTPAEILAHQGDRRVRVDHVPCFRAAV